MPSHQSLLAALTAATLSLMAPGASSSLEEANVSPEDIELPGEVQEVKGQRVYSPFVGRDYPDQVLFGDMHFHTDVSVDAGLIGTKLDVDAAYRFARGEKVISNTGQPVQLVRPLDFLFITDHAEFLGLPLLIRRADPELLADPWGRQIYDWFQSGLEGRQKAFANIIQYSVAGENPQGSNKAARGIWRDFVAKAETYNEPGAFSAMTGFEWTSTPKGDNQHRIVLLADGADKTGQIVPFSIFDSQNPEDLWQFLAEYEKNTGGRAIASPHNGNLSNGRMFSDKDFFGKPMTRDYVERRIRWEPLHEVTQMKGDEESHPLLSPEDEFSNFETWDVSNIAGNVAKEDWMLKYEYGRSALKVGLELGAKLGVNPYQFGFTGSTDTHTGLATSREENYFGKYKSTEPGPNRHNTPVIPSDDPALQILTSQESAAGLTGVWARENTREAIFDALARKEVYSTTGTRIRVRMFAGWDFEAKDMSQHDFVSQGYTRGVPMGSELSKAPKGGAPRFMVRALRDPDGANLDRVQIIKGWIDKAGETHERIYDIAVSGDRTAGKDGRVREAVGSTVDIDKATYTNAIGEPVLAAYWADPDFDPKQNSFYYVRVLEIPTPRWTTYDAAFFSIDRPDIVPATVQDRAYTSPVWYSSQD